MQRIKSFEVDHTKLDGGIYISRIDGDVITYDLRFCKPYEDAVLDNETMHTIEHMLATFTRNSDIGDSVIYFGPMGCQTGFYFLVRDNVSHQKVLEVIKASLRATIDHNGEVFGASRIECGNFRTLDLEKAKMASEKYLSRIEGIKHILSYDEI